MYAQVAILLSTEESEEQQQESDENSSCVPENTGENREQGYPIEATTKEELQNGITSQNERVSSYSSTPGGFTGMYICMHYIKL